MTSKSRCGQDARAAQRADGQDGLDGRIGEHPHHVGGAVAVVRRASRGDRADALHAWPQAERRQRVLDDVERRSVPMSRWPDRRGRPRRQGRAAPGRRLGARGGRRGRRSRATNAAPATPAARPTSARRDTAGAGRGFVTDHYMQTGTRSVTAVRSAGRGRLLAYCSTGFAHFCMSSVRSAPEIRSPWAGDLVSSFLHVGQCRFHMAAGDEPGC